MKTGKDKILTLVPNTGGKTGRVRPGRKKGLPAAAFKPPIWIRTVAGPAIGYGHLRRSMILSRMLSSSFMPLFLCNLSDPWSQSQIMAHNWKFLPFQADNLWKNKPLPAAILIDTRERDGLERLISQAREREVPVISIHDLGLNPLPSDMVVDGSVVPLLEDFPRQDTEFHSGTSFLVLEPSFALLHQKEKRLRECISLVVVCMGGGDSSKHFPRVLEGLRSWNRQLEVIGLPGFTTWGQSELEQKDWSPLRFRWAARGEPADKLIFRADMAVTGGGLSSFEALCAGTPLVATALDEFQQVTIAALAKSGACVDLGLAGLFKPTELAGVLMALDADPAMRQRLSNHGRQIVDGRGAERVTELIRRLIASRSGKTSRIAVR